LPPAPSSMPARDWRSPARAFRSVSRSGIAGRGEPLVLSRADAEEIELLRDESSRGPAAGRHRVSLHKTEPTVTFCA